jgi:phosphohistidine swiveling domain-containing protein
MDAAEMSLSWEREDTHFPDRLSRWGAELYMTRQSRGIRDLCTAHGFIFEGVRFSEIDGWAYVTVVPLGGKARKPPPNWLVPILIRLVPELRQRIRILRRQEREGYWQTVVEQWLASDESKLLADGTSYLAVDLTELGDADLADLITETWDYADRALVKHFHLHAAGINEIMRLGMELNREHNFSTADLSGLLTGLSDTTTGPAAAQAEIVDLIRAHDGEATLQRATSIEELKAIAPQVDQAIDEYMNSWGQRAIRYETAYPTIAEQPSWILDLLKTQTSRPSAADLASTHTATRQEVERRVLAVLGDSPATHDRIERARRAFPIREGNEAATVGLPAAALRRLGQEVGRRLEQTGGLESADHVFDLLPSEVDTILRGRTVSDAAQAAAQRYSLRTSVAESDPPRTYGVELQPPDLGAFPDDVREPLEAVLWFSSKASNVQTGIPDADDSHPTHAHTTIVSGQGVAPGSYQGPARIILDESGFDRIEPGDVLICPITSPVWSMVFASIGALVCDGGGPLSHPAIIAREFSIPAVVATANATTVLKDGQQIRVDGTVGSVEAIG